MSISIVKKEPIHLSGEKFGQLINLSGRQRMLSQRIAFFSVLLCHTNEETKDYQDILSYLNDSFKMFKESHELILNGSQEMGTPGIENWPEVLQVYNSTETGAKRVIEKYINDINIFIESCADKASDNHRLSNIVEEASFNVLKTLNDITLCFEQLAKNNANEADENLKAINHNVYSLLNNITTIAHQTEMISFNAHIIAARAGIHGREFLVVADEISKLTNQINESVDEAKSYLDEAKKRVS